MKLRIFDFYPRIPMFTVLLLFTITFFVYNDFGIRMIFGFAALLYVVLGYLIFRNNNIRLTRIKVLYIVMAAAMTVLPFTGTVENPTVYVLVIDICALAAIIGDVRRSEMALAYKILAGFSVLIALYVIAVRIEPNIYFNGVSRFITQESRDMNRQLLRDGYGITLGGNVVFIDYVLSLCGLLTFNMIMAYKGKLRNKLVYWGILGIGALGMLIVNRKSELLAYMIAVFFCYLIHMSFIKRNGYAGGCGLLIPDAADKAALTGLDQFFLLLIGKLADQGIHASAVMAVQMTVGIQETRLTCGEHGRWLGKREKTLKGQMQHAAEFRDQGQVGPGPTALPVAYIAFRNIQGAGKVLLGHAEIPAAGPDLIPEVLQIEPDDLRIALNAVG